MMGICARRKKISNVCVLRRARGSVWAVGWRDCGGIHKSDGVGDSIRVGFGKLMGLGY